MQAPCRAGCRLLHLCAATQTPRRAGCRTYRADPPRRRHDRATPAPRRAGYRTGSRRGLVGGALLCFGVVAPAPAEPTFADDVAPLVIEHCAPCHRPGGAGPFPLLAYDDVRRRARQIAEVTASRFMPPWKPAPGFGGPFIGSRRLADGDVALFRRWAEAGAPAGDLRRLPPPPAWPEGWRLGTPDVVVTMPEPYTVPADAPDTFRNFVLPIPIGRPALVAGIEFRPGNARVAHHANLRLDPTHSSRRLDAEDPAPGYEGPLSPRAHYPDGHFLGWTPGQLPPLAEPGMAWRLEPGSDFVIQLHMQSTGRPESIRASVGLYFTDDPPTRTPMMLRLGRQSIDIPPGAPRYVVRDRFTLPVGAELIGVQPHAHFRATEVNGFATFPDGRTEPLIRIPDWDFNWQDVYRYETRPFLPAGTTVAMEYVYDNSAANPRNPDHPPRRVRFGQFSNDEMGDLWLQLLPRSEADRRTLVRAFMPKVRNEDIVGYESMLASDPDNAVLHRDVAVLYMTAGRTAAAVRHYRRALALDPASATAHYNLATLLAAGGALDEALRHFRRAVALRPAHAAAHNNLGAVLKALGRPAEAAPHFERAVALDAGNAAAHNNLASALASSGRAADAVRHYRRALALEPDGIEALTSLAWILATSGGEPPRAPAEALALAERAAALTGRRDVNVLATLAAACAATGRFDEALAAQRQALSLARTLGGPGLVTELQRRLALYSQGRPFRPAP